MENSKIAILILSTNAKSYQVFIDAIKESWYLDARNMGYKIFFYSGGHSEDIICGADQICVTEDDSISNCYRKFVAAKDVLLSNFPEIELIYRTNLSSYIDIDNFSKYVKKASFTMSSYHGFKGKANKYLELYNQKSLAYRLIDLFKIGPRIYFFSGAGFFIGKDLFNSLSFIDEKKYLIDDVEIGFQITEYTKHQLSCERVYITDVFTKMKLDVFDTLVKNEMLFHYKFKTQDRDQDAFLLKNFSDYEFRKAFLTI